MPEIKDKKSQEEPLFSKTNLYLFFLGLALLGVGYYLLGQGPADNPLSRTAAPVILFFAYCVVFPAAIIISPRKKQETQQP